MLADIAKNAIIVISLSLIFIPAQMYAANVEKLLETLHSRPQQNKTPAVDAAKDNIIIIQPKALEPAIVEPLNPAMVDTLTPTVIVPQSPESSDSSTITPQITVNTEQNVTIPPNPNVQIPSIATPQASTPPAIKLQEPTSQNPKASNFIPLTPMPQGDALKQDAKLAQEAAKANPQQGIPSISLTDFLIKTTLDEQKKLLPQKPSPTAKNASPIAKTQPKTAEKKKGNPLIIPEESKKTGNLAFLEGCWVGKRPEYATKRIVTERFCFNDKGYGKRYILDPEKAGTCVGNTKALINKDGLLLMDSEKMNCSPSGRAWSASTMQCKGEGEQTPCTWFFKTISGKPSQSYSITFVRE